MSPTPAAPGNDAPARAAEHRAVATPSFRDLSHAECIRLLARNTLGRIAFGFHDRIDIQPIHFVYGEDRLFCRTSAGEKIVTLRHSPWVAFEVDETTGTFDWQSVVVHGTFYPLPEDGSPQELRTRQRALELLRRVVPETGTDADPVPFRDVVFEIVVDSVSGREATTRG